MTNDFYDLLGVGRDASQEEVQRAYRQQVRQYHPDLNDDPRAPAQFTALKKAYETLGDPKERDAYDRLGHEEYVRKRISGLPSPDQWQIPDDAGTGGVTGQTAAQTSTDATGRSVGTGRTDSDSKGSTGGRTTPGAGAGTGSGRSSNGAEPGTEAGTGTGSGTRSRTGSGPATGSSAGSGAGSASAGSARSGGAASPGTATGNSTGTSSAGTVDGDRTAGEGADAGQSGPGLVDLDRWRRRVSRVSLGWPLIAAADSLYLVGLFFYLTANAEGIVALLDRASTGGVRGAIGALAAGNGIQPLPAFVRADLTGGTAIAGVFVVAGTAALPSVYLFIIRETRVNRTPWRPSYLYVVGALAPLAGMLLDLFVADGLLVDAAAYVLLPVGAVVGLPLSAFVRPRVKRFLRRTWRRIRS